MEVHTRATPRRWLALVFGGLAVLFLGGCFVYDAANPQIWFHNLTDQRLVVTVEGTAGPWIQTVAPSRDIEMPMDGCHGTALVVETEEGETIGRVDEPACAGWSLTINEDHSLTYTKD